MARQRTHNLHRVRVFQCARRRCPVVQIRDHDIAADSLELIGLRNAMNHGAHVSPGTSQRGYAHFADIAAGSKNHEHQVLLTGSS
jgi:hypothetical protein